MINIRNLPDNLTQQRDAYRFLSRREVAGENFLKVRTYYNRTGVLELKERVDLAEMRKKIRHASGCPSIENGPSLSYVVRDVDKIYTDEDLTEHFEETDLAFSKCWRIFSRARGEPTKMIRVIPHDPNSYSDKIARGIFIYGRIHRCEPSTTAISKPLIKYCNKCCKSGHLYDECQERKMLCPFCGGEHRSAECKQTSEPKCLNCQGLHPAFSHKCPERKKAPETPQQIAPILPVKLPLATDLPNAMKTVMEYVTLMFMNLMPTDRGQVLHTNEAISRHMFGWTCVTIPNPNGFQLHFKPITPPTV
ncbi:hypothetical protein JTB14_002743 [Gonioctena quinquepunctata]|nr:hypothetical protein JTB14_002743 [Gonioctena quinquepunctata]